MLRTGLYITSIVIVSLLVACTTVTHLKSPFDNSDIISTIKPGTILNITLKNGNEYRIIVSSVSNEEIKGEKPGERFKLDDIEQAKTRKATAIGKTVVYGAVITISYLFWAFVLDTIIAW